MGWMTEGFGSCWGQKFSYPKRPYRLWRPDSLSSNGSLVLGVNQARKENERQQGSTVIALVPLPYFFLVCCYTTEELLDRKVAAPVQKTENTAVGIRHADHVALSIRKRWQSLRRQAAVALSV
jgi:hypothetical protein